MYTLVHDRDSIGTTLFESGDPATLTVSGVFNNIGGAKAIAGWIKSIGGEEEDGVVFIALNDDFLLLDHDGIVIKFAEGHLISVPDDDEVFVDITSHSAEDYAAHFPAHLSALAKENS
ncbi:MAG: hypothetical protein OEZ39_07820 [Gammaproteobacteria bacterium]|nr:hypothetical protein [Gammaproteobacteria bacterium]MDH5651767.1 hypothetical protein [Gammaproteobacteria bacterium]